MTLAYDPAGDTYDPTPKPGAIALKSVLFARYDLTRAEISRDKRRCPPQGPRSEHCEGRAVDAFVRTAGAPEGLRLAWDLVGAHRQLGVQSVIFARRVWGFGHDLWRPYTGPNSHDDHVHVGLTRDAARTLTAQQVVEALDDVAPFHRGAGVVGGAGEDEDVIVFVRDDPGTAADQAWLVVGARKLYIHDEKTLDALTAAGVRVVTVAADIVDRIPDIGADLHSAGGA